MGLELLFLLLPVAALSGWWIGRYSRRKREDCPDGAALTSDYFKGLNFLLNEEPDKAIEVFVRMLEVDSETVETHFALGNLFLRRGEVDRAIRIHQNLIARPTLNKEQRNQALFELGRDYMRAGLLDRAENLFMELVSDGVYGNAAIRQLLDIYQQEKEWDQAIAMARRYRDDQGRVDSALIAQFFCEKAEAAFENGETGLANKFLKRALSEDRNSVRSSLLEARIALANNSVRPAIKTLNNIERQDPNLLREALPLMRDAYGRQGRLPELTELLKQKFNQRGDVGVLLMVVDLLEEQEGTDAAISYLEQALKRWPSIRGVKRLLELKARNGNGDLDERSQLLSSVLTEVAKIKPEYKCSICGFGGTKMHWQCPSCKRWNSIKPTQCLEIE